MLKYTHKLADRKRMQKRRGASKNKHVAPAKKISVTCVPVEDQKPVSHVPETRAASVQAATTSSDDTMQGVSSIRDVSDNSHQMTSPALHSEAFSFNGSTRIAKSQPETDELLAGMFSPSDYQKLIDSELEYEAVTSAQFHHPIVTIPEDDNEVDCEPTVSEQKQWKEVKQSSLDNNCGIGSLFDDSERDVTVTKKPLKETKENSLDTNCGIGSLFEDSIRESTPTMPAREDQFEQCTECERIENLEKFLKKLREYVNSLDSDCEIGSLLAEAGSPAVVENRKVIVKQPTLDLGADLNQLFKETADNKGKLQKQKTLDLGQDLVKLFNEFPGKQGKLQSQKTLDLAEDLVKMFDPSEKKEKLQKQKTLDLAEDLVQLFKEQPGRKGELQKQKTLDLTQGLNQLFKERSTLQKQNILDLGNDLPNLFNERKCKKCPPTRQATLDLGSEFDILFDETTTPLLAESNEEFNAKLLREITLDLENDIKRLFKDASSRAKLAQQKTLDLGEAMNEMFTEKAGKPVQPLTQEFVADFNSLFEDFGPFQSSPVQIEQEQVDCTEVVNKLVNDVVKSTDIEDLCRKFEGSLVLDENTKPADYCSYYEELCEKTESSHDGWTLSEVEQNWEWDHSTNSSISVESLPNSFSDFEIGCPSCDLCSCGQVPVLPVFAVPKDSLENVGFITKKEKVERGSWWSASSDEEGSVPCLYPFAVTPKDSLELIHCPKLHNDDSVDVDEQFVLTPRNYPLTQTQSWAGHKEEPKEKESRDCVSEPIIHDKSVSFGPIVKSRETLKTLNQVESEESTEHDFRLENQRNLVQMIDRFETLRREVQNIRTQLNTRLGRVESLLNELPRTM